MDDATQISVANAMSGLCLTPDMAFYAAQIIGHHLDKMVARLHEKQLTGASYEWFADTIYDLYSSQHNVATVQFMACAAVTGYRNLRRWQSSAVNTAVNIHLNTIGAPDDCKYPRCVPDALKDMRIAQPDHINRDAIWRILVTEPWLTYAERTRAQYRRMASVFSIPGLIEEVPTMLAELITMLPPEPPITDQTRRIQRAIRRAYKLHDHLFGTADLRTLLQGRCLILHGHLYDYSLIANHNDLINYSLNTRSGTPPCHITILRKSDHYPLCILCIYFRDTPLIDHLIAFKLHLRLAETELDMLRIGQAQNITSAFYQDPLLPELKGLHDPLLAPTNFIDNLHMHALCDIQHGALRNSCINFDWHPLATELLDYPPNLLHALANAHNLDAWSVIEQTEAAAPILESVKQCFR